MFKTQSKTRSKSTTPAKSSSTAKIHTKSKKLTTTKLRSSRQTKKTKISPLTNSARTHAGCAIHSTRPTFTTESTHTPTDTSILNDDGVEITSTTTPAPAIRQTLSKDPVQRFNARNEFMRKRHTEKDHLIHTHHNDLRLFSCNLTQTLRTAVKKHKMTRLEAEVWGGYAAGTALYAGLLSGNDRIVMESFLLNKEKDTEETNHIYVEAFAVGEIRGFASIKSITQLPDGQEHSGQGIVRLTKALYQHKRKFTSTLRATGDPMVDWQHIYQQSEQIPTYVQTETVLSQDENGEIIVDFCGASLIQVLGGDANPEEKSRILLEKKLKRNEDETDDQYVKRIQLHEYEQRAIDIDLPNVIKKYGSAGYISTLLGVDPLGLGHPDNIHNIGNIDNVFDWEIFERSLLHSALRDRPLVNVVSTTTPTTTDNDNNDKNDGSNTDITESRLHKDGKFQYAFAYRPLQFFCRCYQTDTSSKLASLPKDLLISLAEDEMVTFTCDFCAEQDEISREQVQNAIAEKDENEKKLLQQQEQEAHDVNIQQIAPVSSSTSTSTSSSSPSTTTGTHDSLTEKNATAQH